MRYIKPCYFDKFACTADKCPDTCCAGWQIVIDEESQKQYLNIKDSFAECLLKGIDWKEGCFHQNSGRCAMLNDSNLCDIVTELGEEYLCETCHRYPRHVEEFDGLREWSLSLSCPVAAQLILENENPIFFVVEEDAEEDPLEEEFEDFDFLLFTQLEDARKVLFGIVTNRNMPLESRKALLLELAEGMQDCLEQERLYDMDNLIASYREKEYHSKQDDYSRFQELQKQFAVFSQLERLREEWTEVLQEAESNLYSDFESYQQIRAAFLTEYGKNGEKYARWELMQENLLVFFLYTYFCGAVYDDWIYTKVALAVFSATFVEEFVMCQWFLADKNISWQDCIALTYRYAREVEHSDENLNMLEEWLQQNPYEMKGTEN